MGRIIFVLLHLITILKLTLIERGDHLCTCVSTRMLHLCPLVVVVIEGIANTHHLAENPIKQSPLRVVSMGEETDATAILPIRHSVNGVGRLLTVAFSKPVGDKDQFPAETNYHVLLQNLAAAAVLLTAAATICLRRPHNLQNSGHGADGWHRGAGNGAADSGRLLGNGCNGRSGRLSSNWCLLGSRGKGNRGALVRARTGRRTHAALLGVVVHVVEGAGGALPCFCRHLGG